MYTTCILVCTTCWYNCSIYNCFYLELHLKLLPSHYNDYNRCHYNCYQNRITIQRLHLGSYKNQFTGASVLNQQK